MILEVNVYIFHSLDYVKMKIYPIINTLYARGYSVFASTHTCITITILAVGVEAMVEAMAEAMAKVHS